MSFPATAARTTTVLNGRSLAGIVFVAFAVRIACGIAAGSVEGGDASEYLRLAHNLAGAHGFSLSSRPPFFPTDWRVPGYPALLAPWILLDDGHIALVIVNAALGAIAVLAIAMMARTIFVGRPRYQLVAAVSAAIYLPSVTFSGLVLSENLLVAAGALFLYLTFFASPITRGREVGPSRRIAWFCGLCLSTWLLTLSRSEGVVLVVLGVLLSAWLGHTRFWFTIFTLVVVLIVPLAWALRNEAVLGRFELSDRIYLDANLLLSSNGGNPHDPLYVKGVSLAYRGHQDAGQTTTFQHQLDQRLSQSLGRGFSGVASFKAKGLGDFFFVPPVWSWGLQAFSKNYLLSHAVRNLTPRNIVRLAWSVLLLVQYALALVGLLHWWARRRYRQVAGTLLYPCLALLLTIPFQADQRQWLFASILLLLPAAEGLAVLRSPRTGSREVKQVVSDAPTVEELTADYALHS